VGTRNIAAVFTAYFDITNPPPGLFVMVILVVPLATTIAFCGSTPVRPAESCSNELKEEV